VPPEPWVTLLPALDATTMGWKDREWYLGPHQPALFDVNGNAGPTIWADGRIVGGWAQRTDGEIAPRLLEDVDARTSRAIDREAARLAEWVGPVSIRSSFPTPLETDLKR
jgi:winged helix DNA-binding protein